MNRLDLLDQLLDELKIGNGESDYVCELADKIGSSGNVEAEVRRELVSDLRRYGMCVICEADDRSYYDA